jgi:adenosine deaminase
MLFGAKEEYDFQTFLGKFEILNEIKWDEKSICKTIEQIVWDIASEKIDYSEIHFTVGKYLSHLNWTPSEAIKFLYEAFERESKKWDIKIGLVLSLKYESDRSEQTRIASVISDPKVADLMVGLDLVGDEQFFNYKFYEPIFKEWKEAGKGLALHVGESQAAKNVRNAIDHLDVDRIVHGIRVPTEDPDLLEVCREYDICFDIAPTSNIMTGCISDIYAHPIKDIIESGCSVTIGTDDPIIYQTTLDKEYSILSEIGIPEDDILDTMSNSIKYSFDPKIREYYEDR